MTEQNPLPDNRLRIWTVYQNPSDYPEKFVARLWCNDQATGSIIIAPDLDTLHETLHVEYGGLHRMARHPDDDPTIVETWF